MTTRVFDLVNGNDANDGLTVNTAWKTSAKFRSSIVAGDTALFVAGIDFREANSAFGTNGQFEIPGNNVTMGVIGTGADPILGMVVPAAVAISTVTLNAGGACTIVTAAAHGLTTGQTVLIAGVAGTASEANANWQVTVTNSTTFTIVGAGVFTTGSDSGRGTCQLVASEKACIYNSGFNTFTAAHLALRNCAYGTRLAGANTDDCTFTYLDAQFMGVYGYSFSGSSLRASLQHCSGSRVREDMINVSGSSNRLGDVGYGTFSYIGYDFAGTKFVTDRGTGPGDGVTLHAGSGNSNQFDVHDCVFSWGTQGAFNNANTQGTSRAWNNYVTEFSGSGFQQSGGGSMLCWNNLYRAPSAAALDNTTQRGMFKFNPSTNVGGVFECYGNTGYTDRGAIGSFATAAAMFIVSGGLTTALTDQFIFKNNRFLSNGTAPFAQVTNQNSVAITNLVLSGGTATVTAAGHGLTTGRKVRIIGVTGGAAAINNQTLVATVIDANTYTVPFAGSGTSTNGSSQRIPNLVCDYNAYSGASSAVLFSYGATSATYTGAAWQGQGFDTHSVFGASCRTTPPVVADDFRLTAASGGLRAGTDLSGLGYAGLLTDRDGKTRPAAPDIGAFQAPAGGSTLGLGVSLL